MPTIRIEFYKGKALTEGRYPICITVTHKGLPKRKSIDACRPEEWDSKNKIIKVINKRETASIINRNNDIDDELTKYKAIFKELIKSGADWNPEDVFKKDIPVVPVKTDTITFWDICDRYLDYIKTEKSGATYITFESIIRRFKEFVANPSFRPEDFTDGLVTSYKRHMIARSNSDSTMNLNFKIIRFASKYGYDKKMCAKPEALHNFRLPKRGKGRKNKLDTNEMTMFENASALKDSRVEEAQDIFLVSYLLRGMRISDVLRMEQKFIQGNRLLYASSKSNKLFDMKIPNQALVILSKYLDGRKYVFRFYNWKDDPSKSDEDNRVNEYKEIKRLTTHVNNRLKKLAKRAGITKTLSTHISRHSFAKKVLSSINDTNITMDLMGHSSLAVHEAYVREVSSSDDLDEAMDKIFS